MRNLTFLLFFLITVARVNAQDFYNLVVNNPECDYTIGDAALYGANGCTVTNITWSTGETTNYISDLAPGNYSVSFYLSCPTFADTWYLEFTILPYSDMITSTDIIHTTCGENNGSITCTMDEPNFSYHIYQFLWSNGATTSSISNLAPGVYNLEVIKGGEETVCTESYSYTINPSTPISANVTPLDTKCGMNNGAATVIAAGGGEGYQYQWSNGQTNPAISGLSAGTYTVTINSNDQCTPVVLSTTVNPSTSLTATIEPIHTTCGMSNGRVVAYGNHPNLNYLWSNGSTAESQENLSAGTYSVTLSDADGCKGEAISTVNASTALTATVEALHTTCGMDNGRVSAFGNLPNLSYLWNNGSIAESQENLSAGNYSVTINDDNGCQDEASTVVNDSEGFNLQIDIVGNAIVAAQNAVDYQWIDCVLNTPIVGENSQTFEPIRNGEYAVELSGRDANGAECLEMSNCINFVLSSTKDETKFWEKVKMPTIIHDELSIQFDDNHLATGISITNMSGINLQTYSKISGNSISFDTAMLQSGVYFITFENSGERFVKKVVKI